LLVDNTGDRAVFVGAGANLPHPSYASPRETLQAALLELDRRGARVLRYSRWYRTAPVPASEQPWYVNAVAEIATSLSADDLLIALHEIEELFGRVRSVPNAPRLIDLDLLDYRGETAAPGAGRAILPHPRMAGRAFVLRPLADLAPPIVRHVDPRPPEGPAGGPGRPALPAGRLAFWAGAGITAGFQEILRFPPMARVTVEDCIVQIPNRFELVMFASQRARDISAGAQITLDRDRDKNPVVALREIAEMKLDQTVLKDSLISGMQKHADVDKPEEVNEMAELEQELAAALAQGGAEAAQPKALPMAEEDDVAE
jgi:2-amino-4-hydroxy-6-hydroxymethyldihydropteridine diphosphokinase/DNA-directed RNA polymerase omega subunit